jgi:hypothetical protein
VTVGASAARTACAASVAALALALAVVAPAAPAADPAPDALSSGDAYVSPRALGPAAPAAQAELAAAAERLARRGQPVKLAIVAGPAGAPSMRVYARRLAGDLPGETTLVVTAPGRPVIAVGPRSPADITRRLRGGAVGAIADPVDRVVRAAALAAPPPRDDEASGTRAVLVLLGLTALGAAWAVAWGARRHARAERERMVEARAAAAVRLDAVAARAGALMARLDLPPAARADAERALAAHHEVAAGLQAARGAEDVARLEPRLTEAVAALSRACAAVGDDSAAGDPFAGLCAADPAHGPAVAEAPIDDRPEPVGVCAACAEAAAAGRRLRARLVPIGGLPAPYTEIDSERPGSG